MRQSYRIPASIIWRLKHYLFAEKVKIKKTVIEAVAYHLATPKTNIETFPVYTDRRDHMTMTVHGDIIRVVDLAALHARHEFIKHSPPHLRHLWRRYDFQWMLDWCLDTYLIAKGYVDTEASHAYVMARFNALKLAGTIYKGMYQQ